MNEQINSIEFYRYIIPLKSAMSDLTFYIEMEDKLRGNFLAPSLNCPT